MNWNELASCSPFRTAVAVREALEHGDVREASAGMKELIDALSRSDRRVLKSHLIQLMAHIIKWQTQPERRTRSWRASIRNARREIAEIQEDTPNLTRAVVESMWASCWEAAKDQAEGEMNQPATVNFLSWEEVFEKAYDC